MTNKSAAELRNQICEYVEQTVTHWSTVKNLSDRARCEGTACSLLVMLDGGMSLYPFTLMSMAEDGTEFAVNEDCNLVDAYKDYTRSVA